ncbi:hypothetical protein AHYW_001769 [Providencia manganoxydans]|uniref:hypothetical protein n=1 Tax=Providencia manganoxydans TaxID=2923283 RepID=UPI003B9C933E
MNKQLIVCMVAVVGVIVAIFIYREASISQSSIFNAIEKKVSSKMKDPSSVIFMDIKVYSTKKIDDREEMKVCGLVNAKNSYGAYAGSRMFFSSIVIDGYKVEVSSVIISNSIEEDKAILQMCNN